MYSSCIVMRTKSWVSDFLVYLTAERGRSNLTIERYRKVLLTFSEFYKEELDEGLDWDVIDDSVVRRWIMTRIEGGTRARTVNADLAALRSFYRYLFLTKKVSHNPMTRVKGLKAEKPLPKFFRDEDVNRLLDNLRESYDETGAYEEARNYLIILLFYTTGMRVSELTGLNVGDVDMTMRYVRVTGKRNKQRIVPLVDEVLNLYSDYMLLRKSESPLDEAVFLSKRKVRVSNNEVESLVKRLVGTVTTQEKRSPHVFRHTFATSMINNQSDLNSVKELLGHASLATTEIYTHTNFEELKKIYEQAHPRG